MELINMDKENLKRRRESNGKLCQLNIRISKETSDWLAKEKLSPTAVFNEACKELGFKEAGKGE